MNKAELKAVENYLYSARVQFGSEKALSDIQTAKDGRHFVCDGYTAFIWERHFPTEIFSEVHPTPRVYGADDGVDIEHIIANNRYGEKEAISAEDALVLANLPKFKKYVKARDSSSFQYGCPIYLFGAVFDLVKVQMVRNIGVKAFRGTVRKSTDMYTDKLVKTIGLKSVHLEGGGVSVILMGMHADRDGLDKLKAVREDFLKDSGLWLS